MATGKEGDTRCGDPSFPVMLLTALFLVSIIPHAKITPDNFIPNEIIYNSFILLMLPTKWPSLKT